MISTFCLHPRQSFVLLFCICLSKTEKYLRENMPPREQPEPEKSCPLAGSVPQTLGTHPALEASLDQTSICSCRPGSPTLQFRGGSLLISLNTNMGPPLQVGPPSSAPSFRAWPHHPTKCTDQKCRNHPDTHLSPTPQILPISKLVNITPKQHLYPFPGPHPTAVS